MRNVFLILPCPSPAHCRITQSPGTGGMPSLSPSKVTASQGCHGITSAIFCRLEACHLRVGDYTRWVYEGHLQVSLPQMPNEGQSDTWGKEMERRGKGKDGR